LKGEGIVNFPLLRKGLLLEGERQRQTESLVKIFGVLVLPFCCCAVVEILSTAICDLRDPNKTEFEMNIEQGSILNVSLL